MNKITIEDLRYANNNYGDNYFDFSTLKFFKSKINTIIGTVGEQAYFIESITDHSNKERHVVRKFTYYAMDKGKVDKKIFGTYKTLIGAVRKLESLCN